MSKRLKIWGISVAVVAVVGTVVGISLNHWVSSSATGSVHVGSTSAQPEQAPQVLTLTNHYFSTLLPAGFSLKRQQDTPTTATLLRSLALSSSQQAEQFAATVGSLPTDGLQGVGDYNLRTTQTTSYQPYNLPRLPAGAKAFRVVDGPAAITVFWPHSTIYAELSFSSEGGASLERLAQVYTQVISSWSWKQ